MRKIIKGDTVKVISGKHKGKQGVVTQSFPKENKVLIEGINKVKKHMKADQKNPNAGILEIERPMHLSKVALVDPKTKGITKVSFKLDKDGKKVRFAKASDTEIKNK